MVAFMSLSCPPRTDGNRNRPVSVKNSDCLS